MSHKRGGYNKPAIPTSLETETRIAGSNEGFFGLSKTAWIRRGFHPADQHFGPINPDGPMFSVEYVEYPALRFISPTGPNLPKNDMNSLPSDTSPTKIHESGT